MKSGWVTKKLGEVCEDSIRRLKEIDDSRFLYIDISSIDRVRKTVIGATEYDRTSAPGRAQQVVEAGDVLVSTVRPNLNAVAIVEGRSDFRRIASTGFCVLRAGECVIPRYIYYFTQVDEFIAPLVAVSEKAAYPSVTDKIVKNVDIPIPPLAEQKRIVAKIDAAFEKIDALKANAEKNLANAKELFQSALDEAMRPKWVEKRLGEVCDTITAKGHQIQQKEIVESGKYPVVSQSEQFIEGYTDFNEPVKSVPVILFGDHTCCSKYIDFPFVVGADGTKLLKVNQGYAKYFYYVILKIGISLVDGKYRRHFKDLKKAGVHLPPIDEQQRLAKQLDSLSQKTETLQQNYARQIADCAEMRQAILREAFEGRL